MEAHQIEYDFDEDVKLTSIQYFYNKEKFYIFFISRGNSLYELDRTFTNYQQLLDFLFDAIMQNLVVDLAETFWIDKKLKTKLGIL